MQQHRSTETRFERAQDAFAGVLANVTPDQLDAPTPCSEWTIRDLIEHVVSGNEHVGQWAGSYQQPPARPDNVVDAHRATAAAAQEVLARPDGMAITFELPFARIPGRPFREEQPCPVGRPPADQLAAFLGRKVA